MEKIEKAVLKINKEFGEIAFKGSDRGPVEAMPTGIEALDIALGCGGLPRGRVVEFFGLPGSAKTSMALYIAGVAQKRGESVAFVDAEHALDMEHAANMGLDVENTLIIHPEFGEQALEAVEHMIREKTAGLVIIDSVSSLVPKAEIEGELNRPSMGGQARLLAAGLRRLVPLLSRTNAVVIFINQLRMNIMGGQYDPYITPGGMSLRFYTSVRVSLRRVKEITVGGELAGQTVEFNIKKNKVGRPNEKGEVRLFYDRGFDSEIDYIEAGVEKGVITREGNSYLFAEKKLGLGKEKSLAAIMADPALKAAVREAILR